MPKNTTSAFSKPAEPGDDLLTVREVARRLRVDDTTVRRWINNGVLDAVTLPHVGRRKGYRVKKTTLDAMINNPQGIPA